MDLVNLYSVENKITLQAISASYKALLIFLIPRNANARACSVIENSKCSQIPLNLLADCLTK